MRNLFSFLDPVSGFGTSLSYNLVNREVSLASLSSASKTSYVIIVLLRKIKTVEVVSKTNNIQEINSLYYSRSLQLRS